jgi:hypothetical protein
MLFILISTSTILFYLRLMKKSHYLLGAILILFAACSVNKPTTAQSGGADSLSTAHSDSTQTGLTTKMTSLNKITEGDSLLLRFAVKNNSSKTLRFCKWHTPFEPLMSKYLDVKNEKGEEMAYQGVMAKRIMPPPESSYLSLKPQDSIITKVDLRKAYAITKPGTYHVTYVGGNISGLTVTGRVTFTYVK